MSRSHSSIGVIPDRGSITAASRSVSTLPSRIRSHPKHPGRKTTTRSLFAKLWSVSCSDVREPLRERVSFSSAFHGTRCHHAKWPSKPRHGLPRLRHSSYELHLLLFPAGCLGGLSRLPTNSGLVALPRGTRPNYGVQLSVGAPSIRAWLPIRRLRAACS